MAADDGREVIFVVYDGAVLLDVAGPLQVLHGSGGYRVRLVSPDGRPVRTDVGVWLGVDLALPVANHLVMFLHRPGGQARRDSAGVGAAPGGPVLRRVLDAVEAQPSAEHTLATMAARAAVSKRQLTRLFRREIGTTPARYVELIRVHAARALLETGDAGVTSIAQLCGFGSAETMRRAFLRVAGVTPATYRRRFRGREVHEADVRRRQP